MGKLAITGGKPVRTKPFPKWPCYGKGENKLLAEVIESGIWGGYNIKVSEFENAFAEYCDAKLCILAVNGTVTLVCALISCGVSPGDEVIVTPISFISTASSVLLAGAIPIFVDVESDTYNIDPDKIEKAITKRTKAIIPVHFSGQPANMKKINEIAKKNNLYVIEDAAHAHGAEWQGKRVGSMGDFGSFSFQNTKLLTCGEGGALTTNDPDLADKARSYFNQGRKPKRGWFEHFTLGTNCRISAFQAAVLVEQLKKLPEENERRKTNIEYLIKKIKGIDGLIPLRIRPEVTYPVYYIFSGKYIQEKFDGIPKETFFKALESEGIPKPEFYPYPLYKNPVFSHPELRKPGNPLYLTHKDSPTDYDKLSLPESERAIKEGFWLAHQTFLGTTKDMDDIAEAIIKIRENTNELKNIK
jgi:dTDP-4-amino-4,6-dideoxygalactose transaminase